jgi:UDP-3-O-[3-hydroxymyristoyl] glucosamine N-acyltransferase
LKAKIFGEKVKMGRSVKLGENAVIKGNDINIEDDVSIGNNTLISAQKIHIGLEQRLRKTAKSSKCPEKYQSFL